MRRGGPCVHESNYGNRRLLRARGEWQRSRRSGNPCNKIPSSHCLPEAWDHAKISFPTQAIKTGICDQRYGAQWSICAAKILSRPSRLGVKSGPTAMSVQYPVCPKAVDQMLEADEQTTKTIEKSWRYRSPVRAEIRVMQAQRRPGQ